MPQEKIIIKFEAVGQPALVQAINGLAKAQANLEKKLKTTTSSTTSANNAIKKISPAFSSLSAKIIAHGKTWDDLGISHKLAEKAMFGNKIALEKLRMAMAKAQKAGMLQVRNNRLVANSFATLRSQLLLISFGAMLIERAFVSLVKAYGRQEAANEKLRVGLGNVQDTTEGVTQRLVDYSAALQQATAFGDEMITTGMVQFTTFGLNEQAIKALTPQVLNVARAIQTVSGAMPDLNSLFIAFGKATTTGIGTLTRYGVVLTETERSQLKSMDANESAVKIAEILKRQYGGLAEAYAKTTSGMLEAAAAARGDAAESLGQVLAPLVLGMSKALKVMFEAMSPERIARFGTALGVAGIAAGVLSGNLMKAIKALKAFQIAQIKTGWGAIAAGIGIATFAAMEYFDVFDDGEETLTDAQKRQIELIKAISELAKAQEEGAEKLQKQLDLLSAKTEVDKMLIQLGHEASDVELELINKIVAKTEALKVEQALKKNEIALNKEALDLQDRINLLSMEAGGAKETDLLLTREQLRFNKELRELEGDGIKIWTDGELVKLDLLKEEHRLIMQIINAKQPRTLAKARAEDTENQIKLDREWAEGRSAAVRKALDAEIDFRNALAESRRHAEELKEEFSKQFDDPPKLDLVVHSLKDMLTGMSELSSATKQQMELDKTWAEINQAKADIIMSSMAGVTSAWSSNLNARLKAEIDTLKESTKYKKADNDTRKKLEKEKTDAFASEQKNLFYINKAMSLADVYFNTASAVMKSIAVSPLTAGQPWAGIAKVLGVIQAGIILTQPAPKFARGGMIGGRRHSQGGTMIEAEQGEFVMSRSAVDSVGIENLNRMNQGGGGGSVTVNVSGNVMSQDYVEGELAEQIKEAVRRGNDFGIG